MQHLQHQVGAMQKKSTEDTFDPSEFEEPELFESMKILKRLDDLDNSSKKSNLSGLKKSSIRDKQEETKRIKSKLKRPY